MTRGLWAFLAVTCGTVYSGSASAQSVSVTPGVPSLQAGTTYLYNFGGTGTYDAAGGTSVKIYYQVRILQGENIVSTSPEIQGTLGANNTHSGSASNYFHPSTQRAYLRVIMYRNAGAAGRVSTIGAWTPVPSN